MPNVRYLRLGFNVISSLVQFLSYPPHLLPHIISIIADQHGYRLFVRMVFRQETYAWIAALEIRDIRSLSTYDPHAIAIVPLLGVRSVAAMSAEEFDLYLKESVFDVCGMRDTGYFELDRLPAGCANNYIYDGASNSYRTNIYSVDAKGTGAGGAFVTVPDIIRFWEGLTDGKLLPPIL